MQLSFCDPVLETIYCSGKNPKGYCYSITTRKRLIRIINSIKAIKYLPDLNKLKFLDHFILDHITNLNSVKVDSTYRLEFICNENINFIKGINILRLTPIHFQY